MYAKLTNGNVPIERAFTKPEPVTVGSGDQAIQYPANIFMLWTDAELNAIGYARMTEVHDGNGEFKVRSDHVDTFVDGVVTRTYSYTDASIDKVHDELKSRVKSKRNTVRDAGIEWSPDGGVTVYVVQTDGDSRREMTGAVVGINEGSLTEQAWRMMDNSVAVLSATDFKAMALAVREHVNACYLNQATFEAAVDATSTVAEAIAIDLDAGWPAHYTDPNV